MTVRRLTGPVGLAVLVVLVLLCAAIIALAANDAEVLKQRYRLSRLAVQNAARQGDVVMTGARLRVSVGGLPAEPFRVVQAVIRVPGKLRLPNGMAVAVRGVATCVEPLQQEIGRWLEPA